jgi:maltose-binding protein MalE
LAVGAGRPRLTNYGEVDAVIFTMVNNVATGKIEPKPALAAAAVEITKLLVSAGYKVP